LLDGHFAKVGQSFCDHAADTACLSGKKGFSDQPAAGGCGNTAGLVERICSQCATA